MSFIHKKKDLPDYLVEKQKAKGTYDSPCMSVCDYSDNGQCQTCLMFKEEKQLWKIADDETKSKLTQTFQSRFK